MWSPALLSNFHLHKQDIVNDNITILELLAMHDAMKG